MTAPKNADGVIAMVGNSKPLSAPREGQAIGVGEAPVSQFKNRLQIKAERGARGFLVKGDRTSFQIAGRYVVIIRRHKSHTVRIL
jgi:hypothetical protein